MYVLGISGFAHDSAAALLGDQGIVAAIEESKLSGNSASIGIPREAVYFCLKQAGIRWEDLDCVAVASRPLQAWARESWLRASRAPLAPIASGYYETRAVAELARQLNHHRILKTFGAGPKPPVISLDHHLCHAASAFYASPFDQALILTLDEEGDGHSALVARGEGTKIHQVDSLSFPHSPAWVYSQITQLLGFTPRVHEHKTQWLSLEAEPVFSHVFVEMLRRSSNPAPHLDFRYFNRGLSGEIAFSKKFYDRLGIRSEAFSNLSEEKRAQIASSLQHAVTTVVAEWAEELRQRTGMRHLCLAGGLFLNVLLVSALEKNTGFESIFVQPAAGNAGGALGAAWLIWHERFGKPRTEPLKQLYWGPSYTSEHIKQVLDNCKAQYRWYDSENQKIEETIRLLEAGKIVAWFQGAAEFGPRALGNRSLLGSPWAPYIKENLNDYVKHRESFRPFAVAVTAEDCAKYFNCSPMGRFMATLGSARPEAAELLKGFLLPDNRLRLHVVDRSANALFWQLLKRFGDHAAAPILINTSFNLAGEPLVTRPRSAVRSYFCSGIDALVIGNFLLRKT
jgi:carbamoyltransferase